MNLSPNWSLHIDPSVFKTLKKIPKRDTAAIVEVTRLLPSDPYFGDIQKLKDVEDVWRRRVGAYRIFYALKQESNIILVSRIERRTSKTY